LFKYSLRFWQAPHPWMFVPATLSITLAMGCAMRSTRSPSPVIFFLTTLAGSGKSIVSGSTLGLMTIVFPSGNDFIFKFRRILVFAL